MERASGATRGQGIRLKLSAAELEAAFGGLLRRLGKGFEAANVPWMVVGGLAVSAWTEPRGTKNCDIALVLPEDPGPVGALLDEVGVEITRGELVKAQQGGVVRGHYCPEGLPRLVVDLLCSGTDFERSALSRREAATILGTDSWIVSADDLLIYKLIAGRPQDLADVDKLIRFGRAPKDRAYVDKWVREWDLKERLSKAIETARR